MLQSRLKGTAYQKPPADAPRARAAEARRVCQTWHVASEVKVLTPGNRRAE